MSMNRTIRRKLAKAASKVPPPRHVRPDPGVWGVWVSPTLFVTAGQLGKPPARFFRVMQRLLLGWRWAQKAG